MTVGSIFGRWFTIPLWQRILAALVLGAVAGLLLGDRAEGIRWVGDLFIRMIRMLVVPLVFVTLVAGITAMRDPARIASIGGRTIALYLCTTIPATLIGIGLALLLRPGVGIEIGGVTGVTLGAAVPLGERLMAIVPENVFAAFAEGDVLAIIFFAVLVGAGTLLAGEKGQPVANAFASLSAVILRVTAIVMEVAPFGVFALVAWVMGTEGPRAFLNVALLGLIVYLGGALQMVVVHAGLARAGGVPLRRFFAAARTAQLLAFSTSSSAATMPATLAAAERGLGIGKPVASATIPLGTTINMDGTGLYVAAVAVFAAQLFGLPLSIGDYGMILLTATLVSIGAASVPSASLFLLAVVLEAIGITPEQTAIVIGLLLPFDRLLDMWRTVVNVTGDLGVAAYVAHAEGEIALPPENAAAG